MPRPRDTDLSAVTTLLLDADGTLFPSEEPAFAASATVVNDLMAVLGDDTSFDGEQLRLAATGRNFRGLVTDLARERGLHVPRELLDHWVQREMEVVTEHLRAALRPDPAVGDALTALRGRFGLALVSSSALRRLDACLDATGLDELFPAGLRFSAQDSLTTPTSKPDPQVYLHAARALGIEPWQGLAVEDATAGVVSARDAGVPVLGTMVFVAHDERSAREDDLLAAGAIGIMREWDDLLELLLPAGGPEVDGILAAR